jgi:hypothetical protein
MATTVIPPTRARRSGKVTLRRAGPNVHELGGVLDGPASCSVCGVGRHLLPGVIVDVAQEVELRPDDPVSRTKTVVPLYGRVSH